MEVFMKKLVLFSLVAFLCAPLAGIATSFPVKPSVSIALGYEPLLFSPPKPSYFRIGYQLIAWVSADTTGSPDIFKTADVYVGTALPNGQFASWVQNGTEPPVWRVDAVPLPLMKNIPLDTTSLLSPLQHTFSDGDPLGFYIAYALLVLPGTDPLDSLNWIDVSTVPFKLAPALATPRITR